MSRSHPIALIIALVLAPMVPPAVCPAQPRDDPAARPEALTFLVGEFDQATVVRMGPGEPIRARALARGRWIMGGRFVQVDVAAAPGEPMRGERLLIYGYDPSARHFTLYNIETENAVATTATGKLDPASGQLTFDGERASDAGKVPFRWTLRPLDGGGYEQKVLVPGGKPGEFREAVTARHSPHKAGP